MPTSRLILPLLFVLLALPVALRSPPGDAANAAAPQLIHPDPAKLLASNGTHLFTGRSHNPEASCPQAVPIIRRMNLDGSNPVTLFEGCHLLLEAMAADALHVYYVYNQDIHRISVSGGAPQTVVADLARTTVALDDQFLYWGHHEYGSITIYRQDKNGGVPQELLTLPDPLQMRVRDLAVDDSHVYWVMGNLGVGEVRRVPKAGGASQVLADTADGLNFPREISLDANHVYWTEDYAAQVRRVAKSGGPVTTYTPASIGAEGNASNVAVGDSHIFWWWDGWGTGPGRIRRAPKGGGTIEDIVFDVDYSSAVLGQGGHVYWSQIDAGILRLPADAAPVSIDLMLDDMEVTQGLQNLSGTAVPLAARKDTYVRAFVRADYPFIENVTAVLRGYSPSDVLLGEVEPLNPSLLVGLIWERRLLDDAFNFRVPEDWVQPGGVRLCVEINPGQPIAELDLSNNELCRTVPLTSKAPVCLRHHPVDVTGTPFLPTPNETDFLTGEMIRNWWPAQIGIQGAATLDKRGNPYNIPEDTSRLLNKLERRMAHDILPPEWCQGGVIHYVAVVHESADTEEVFGSARESANVLWYKRYGGFPVTLSQAQIDLYQQRYGTSVPLISWPFAPHILAHEMGHNLDRPHIDCGNPEDPVATDYPYSPCNFTAAAPAPQATYGFFARSLGDAGLARNWTIVDETDMVAPIMSYEDPSWLSDYTYNRINNTIPEGLLALNRPHAASGEMALASLLVEPGGGELDGVERMPQALFGAPKLDDLYTQHLALLDPAGDYRLELLDAGGALLASYRFQVELDADVDAGGGMVFPFPTEPGWATLSFYGPAGLLDAQPVSANAPTVTVLSPNGGESVGDDGTIKWEAADPDGDELSFTIHYSSDSGQSWQVIASDVGATEPFTDVIQAPWPPFETPGSVGSSLVRVIADDGANRGWDQSDRPFSLELKRPTVAILSPGDGDMLAHGKSLIFSGWAQDPEDGELEGSALTWRLDGQPIGTGRKISAEGLAPGEHFLNLKATDSDGMEAEDRVRFFVSGGSCPLFNREVDILFLIDSSSLMMNNMTAVGQDVGEAVSWLQNAGMDVASENYCVTAGSCTGPVVADVHPGTAVDNPADWGEGIASLAAHYGWRENSTRIIVPISNQAPEDGGPVEDPGSDRDALETAVAAANAHGVAVAPLMLPGPGGQDPPVPLQALAKELATRTGGVPADEPDGLGPLLHGVKSSVGCQPRVRDVSVPAHIAETGEAGRLFVRGQSLWPGLQVWLDGQRLPVGEERSYGTGLSLLVHEPLAAGCHDLVVNRPGVAERTVSCAVFVSQGALSLYLPVVMRSP